MTDPVVYVDPEMNVAHVLNVMGNLRIMLPYAETVGRDYMSRRSDTGGEDVSLVPCMCNIPIMTEVQHVGSPPPEQPPVVPPQQPAQLPA